MTNDVLLLILGMISGMTAYVLGLGGGIIIVPVLSQVFKIPMHQTVGISLCAVSASSLFTAFSRIKQGEIAFRLSTTLECISMAAALFGAHLALEVDDAILRKVFATMVTCVAVWMFYEIIFLKSPPKIKVDPTEPLSAPFFGTIYDATEDRLANLEVKRFPVIAGVNAFTSVMSAMIGVGGNLINVPLLNSVGGVPIRVATATSAYMMGVTVSGAAVVFWLNGFVTPSIALLIVAGVYLGNRFSQRYLAKLSSPTIRLLFLIVLVSVGVKMWVN